jgi:DNA-binding transcriptional LysR family regulator
VKSVANTGCFSASARLFGVSQPTISNAIADLEEELHVRIFRRTTRCVELTPFGAGIVSHVDSIVGLIEDIEQQSERYCRPERRLLKVAFSPIVDGPRLFCLFEAFRVERRGLDFVYKESAGSELETHLGQEKVDLICGIRIRNTRSQGRCPVYRESLRYLPRGGVPQGPSSDQVWLADVARQTLILPADGCDLAPATRELFRRQGLDFDEYPGHPLSYAVLQEWTHQGLGAAILPESRIVGDAKAYPLIVSAQGWPERITVEAVWVRANRDPVVRELARFLKDAARATLAGRRCPAPAADSVRQRTAALPPAITCA